MTTVFVWKNYGEVSVYAFETSQQQSDLCYKVYENARYTAVDSDDADAVDEIYEQDIPHQVKIEKLLKNADIFNDNETFEHGTGFVEVQE
jgi:hypothetical protein